MNNGTNVEYKHTIKHLLWERNYIWNAGAVTYEIDKHLKKNFRVSVITVNEIIEATKTKLINFIDKKQH